MKKTLLFVIAVGALFAASCSKADIPQTGEIKLNLIIADPGAETKAAKKGWAAGDKLNIWFGVIAESQTVPDLIITYNGTAWTAGALRTGCTPSATGKLTFLYEGYNDVSSNNYNYNWYADGEWFTPKPSKEEPDNWDSYCRPLVVSAYNIDYTFSENTLTASIASGDWSYWTRFKVLIKNLSNPADYYNLQVGKNTGAEYADTSGAWIIFQESNYSRVGQGSSNNYGWTGGVQEADGIAFYYNSFSAVAADNITFKLKEYNVNGTKSYTVTGKTITANAASYCVGVVLDYNSFTAD